MAWVFGTVAVSLAIVFVWGLVSPRSQWRVLSSWSVSDPHAHEPGGASYTVRRLLSAFGLLGIAGAVAMATVPGIIASIPKPPSVVDPVAVMWGEPTPQLVDRVVFPGNSAPDDLAEMPVLSYQDLSSLDELPAYLVAIRPFTLLGDDDPAGYVGADAEEGFSAIGQADLVLHVRGPALCIPREVVAIETDTTVSVGVFYGLPDPESDDDDEDAPKPDHLAACSPDDHNTGSVLVPVSLEGGLGDRTVTSLEGDPIEAVSVVE